DAVAGTQAVIRDSRKTWPGRRSLQKYAVRCGGGVNHRKALGGAAPTTGTDDGAPGSVRAAAAAARRHPPARPREVEVHARDQRREPLSARAAEVLLDNFPPEQCSQAARLRADLAPKTRLEASGGLTLSVARAYAEAGVDYLAVGGLTHSAPALDIGMDMRAG